MAVRITNFQLRNSYINPVFKQCSILKLQDKICLENILFVSKSLTDLNPRQFSIHGLVFLQINITMKPQVLQDK